MKLVYFNGRGFAETSRLILALKNIDYEDYRYPIEVIDWKTHNIVKKEFDADKQNGRLEGSLNKLPYLLVNGYTIPQSKAIERYLAEKYGMMGSGAIERAKIDSICECVRDFKDLYQSVRRLGEEEKEEGMNKWFSETLPEKMCLLENIVGNEKHCVGNADSLADIVIYSFITQFFDAKEKAMASLDSCPKLHKIVVNIASNSNIKKWLSKRPDTPF
jgi:glutathione S-transferase